MERNSLVNETKTLKRKAFKVQEMIGDSAAIRKIKETIDKVGPTEARVLITGENGVGKELVARWLHEKSSRAGNALVEVNCAAIPGELIESELFGHEKGSLLLPSNNALENLNRPMAVHFSLMKLVI
jgi:Transcriptional regulator containing GAF, AAA-type ATPase, and DNA binding domains